MFLFRKSFFINNYLLLWCIAFLPIFIAMVVTFLISNVTGDYFQKYLPISDFNMAMGRSLFFLLALLVLISYITLPIKNFFIQSFNKHIFLEAVIIFTALMMLISTISLSSMGAEYGEISMNPFLQDQGYYNRRMLMPSIAHYLQFQGNFFYNVFHFIVTFFLIYFVIYWIKIKKKARFNLLQLLSVFSAGLVIFQFQFPGYVEQGVLLLLFLTLLVDFDTKGRLVIFILMMLCHEGAAIIMGIPGLFISSSKKEKWLYVGVVCLFLFFWAFEFQFNVIELFYNHIQLGEKSNIYYFISNIWLVFIGIFFAYKFLWIFFVYSVFISFRRKEYDLMRKIIFIIFIPFLILPLVDVSRDISWGYLGILMALIYSYSKMKRLIFNFILVINLLLPSIYVGTNTGMVSFFGLYDVLVEYIKEIML